MARGSRARPLGAAGRVSLHPEVLELTQDEVLTSAAEGITSRGYRLGGGTALALVFGHRKSVDFDWFTEVAMGDPMRLARELEDLGLALEIDRVSAGTLHGKLRGVRMSFLEYRYPALAEPIEWPERRVALLSLDDIACMKLSAIAQRGSRRDFVDLFVLCREHRPLEELLELYRKKFEIREIGHLLYSLVYFEDAERERMPEMLWDIRWEEVKEQVEAWVRHCARR